MGNGSGVSRGDRNRNARLARLRVGVPVTNAIVGIDLADRKQIRSGTGTAPLSHVRSRRAGALRHGRDRRHADSLWRG